MSGDNLKSLSSRTSHCNEELGREVRYAANNEMLEIIKVDVLNLDVWLCAI